MALHNTSNQKLSILRFLIPSFCGILLFLVPCSIGSNYMVIITFLSRLILYLVHDYLPYILLSFFWGVALLTLWVIFVKPAWTIKSPWIRENFVVGQLSLLLRILSALWVSLVFFQVGPQVIIRETTGRFVLYKLLPTLLINMVVSAFFLPFLLDFGLLEFIGTLIEPIMRPLFRLPGRAAINCLVAWIGDGSVGTFIAMQEYKKKYYNDQEVSIIVTSFSAVSITFCLSMLAQVHLENYFLAFYGTVILSSLLAALILPRIPPLSWKNSQPITPTHATPIEKEAVASRWQRAILEAKQKAAQQSSLSIISLSNFKKMTGMITSLFPSIMIIGGASLVVANYTSFFSILGRPFIFILDLLRIPESAAVAKVIFVGFADMFIPAVMIAHVSNPMTRFIVVCLAVSQLVYLSELGALLIGSRSPLNFWDILLIFLLRTLITLPIIVLFAHYIF
ncbi:MAG: YjiH family protein [Bacteroidota bacterium]